MASIKVSDLLVSGANLFLDSESFLDGLTDAELNLNGGAPLQGSGGSGSAPSGYSPVYYGAMNEATGYMVDLVNPFQ